MNELKELEDDEDVEELIEELESLDDEHLINVHKNMRYFNNGSGLSLVGKHAVRFYIKRFEWQTLA